MADPAHARFGDLLPAHALGALEGEELAELEHHLASGCPHCRRELARWRHNLERLAAAVPPVEPVPASRAALQAWVANETSRRRTRPWLPLLGAAAGLVLVAAMGIWWLQLSRQLDAMAARQVQLESRLATVTSQLEAARREGSRLQRTIEMLTASGTRTVLLAGLGSSAGAHGRVYLDPAAATAVFYADHLPALSSGQIYQLWFIAGGEPVSAGTFEVDASGRGAVEVTAVAPPATIQAWAVTIEPAGGVPRPTGEMVLRS